MPKLRVLAWLSMSAALSPGVLAAERDPVAWWPLDETGEADVLERASGSSDRLEGHHRLVDGVAGKALVFDGYTTVLAFRWGLRHTLDGTDLVAWIETRSEAPVRIRLSPIG